MKKFFFACFCFVLISCTTVFAANEISETIGYVQEICGGVAYVVGEPLKDSGYTAVAVNIGDAPIYDLRTGFRVFAHEIQADMDIRVAYIIPENPRADDIFSAVVVWLNWDDDDAAVFTVTVSENITYGADNLVFLSADGKYRVALTPETQILDPAQGSLTLRDIEPGMEFFVWVDILTASTPALIYPEKMVLVY